MGTPAAGLRGLQGSEDARPASAAHRPLRLPRLIPLVSMLNRTHSRL